MRILDIRETAIPLKSDLTNSSFDFTEMTTSIVAVITDVVRDGKPVTGFAFNSTGRYACGAQMRERFIPRILRADPASLLDDAGNIDPARVLAAMCRREKIGGDAERSIAIGTHRGRGVGRGGEDRGCAAPPPARRPLQRRPDPRESVLLCRRRLVPARADRRRSAGRDARPSRCRLHHGEDEGRRHAGRRGLPAHRGGARRCWATRRGSPSMPTASSRATRRSPTPGHCGRSGSNGSRSPAIRWTTRSMPRSPRPMTRRSRPARTSIRRRMSKTSCASAACTAGRDFIQVDPPQAYGIAQYGETVAMLEGRGWSREQLFPHGGNQMSLAIAAGFGLGGAESYPGVFGAFGGFADDATVEDGFLAAVRPPRHRLRGPGRALRPDAPARGVAAVAFRSPDERSDIRGGRSCRHEGGPACRSAHAGYRVFFRGCFRRNNPMQSTFGAGDGAIAPLRLAKTRGTRAAFPDRAHRVMT